MNTVRLKRDLITYLQDFPDELMLLLAPRVEKKIRKALLEARSGMPISRRANNLRVEGLPKIRGTHTTEVNVYRDLELVAPRMVKIQTSPTFEAHCLFDLKLPFKMKLGADPDFIIQPDLYLTEALKLDLTFSDEINDIYLDYLTE